MFKQANKRQILKDVHDENLWLVGKRKSRRSVASLKSSKDNSSQRKWVQLSPIFVAMGGAFVAVVVTLWFEFSAQKLNDSMIDVQHSAQDYSTGAQSPLVYTAGFNDLNDAALLAPVLPHERPVIENFKPVSLPNASSPSLPGLFVDEGVFEDLEAFELRQATVTPENYHALAGAGIPLAQLFGLNVKTIVIDPGHGGKDPGAVGASVYEKDIALDVAKRLRDRLLEYEGYRVLMTREVDETMALNDRVNFANANSADLFISIHVNYFPGDQKSFIETYYFGPTDDSKIAELAARENNNSHYPYAEFKEIILKIGDTLKSQESKQLAYAVQRNLHKQMHKIDKGTRDHGIKAAPFVVLLGLDAPGILAEVSCLCNRDEEQRLKTSEHRESIASFLEKGIVTYLNKNTRVGGKRNGEKEKLAKAQQ
ncbi:MAG: N-acetylmuramoyl-L-alanine amidase [Gammaproteobacteria bacterium]|nr:N-acetylmuramoyl-L-alanine amidase [Gammaproteobacteria bacterium]